MTPSVRVLSNLVSRLTAAASSNERYTGALYGLEIKGQLIVVAAAGKHVEQGRGNEIELLNEMMPCGIEPIGIFDTGTGSCPDRHDLIPVVQQLPPSTHDIETPVVLGWQLEGGFQGFLYTGDDLVKVEVGEISQEELDQATTLVRVKGRLSIMCGQTEGELANNFRHLIEKVSCPYGSFLLTGSKVLFLHKFVEPAPGSGWTAGQVEEDKEECIIVGVEDQETPVDKLWEFLEDEEEDDGWGTPGTKTKKKSVIKSDRLEFEVLWNYCNPACTSRTIGCAPLIHYEKKTCSTVKLPIPIDTLGVIPNNAPCSTLMEVLKGSVARQIGDIAASVLSEFKMRGTTSLPEIFHFKPIELGHYLTSVYTKAASTATFESFRRSIHQSFFLPLDRPLIRRANAVTWSEKGAKEKLRNVHVGIEGKHGVAGGEVRLVQGTYTYFHYMQDSFDDDGWGCAYRSLQTLISWFRHQGYTETDVPTHKDIQKCLVDIGDKESKFIGSKQWIGSTEVGFVLETACHVQSRFVSVNTGADLGTKTRELFNHFETHGSPVMIGGGVYAHTILGVAWDEATGETSWLILDPHYTGSEDVKTIISKGWCGWKGAKFWNQTAFYNMCLPQRPVNVL